MVVHAQFHQFRTLPSLSICIKAIPTYPFTYGLLMSLGYLPITLKTLFLIFVLRVKGCPPPKILIQVKGCPPPKRGDLCVITHFLILNLNIGVDLKQIAEGFIHIGLDL
ncbi:hypothetical protein GIB67_007807 [Kingdonia uniflora]|uniref:Uncharacterized protein n=1 Tax=Kingdonia uniflora TaxID=39325 RepID=A0A7J7N210_9MAGN|nr:hypothetical protein GIB67_007807 [Kingdonia uniflora]